MLMQNLYLVNKKERIFLMNMLKDKLTFNNFWNNQIKKISRKCKWLRQRIRIKDINKYILIQRSKIR